MNVKRWQSGKLFIIILILFNLFIIIKFEFATLPPPHIHRCKWLKQKFATFGLRKKFATFGARKKVCHFRGLERVCHFRGLEVSGLVTAGRRWWVGGGWVWVGGWVGRMKVTAVGRNIPDFCKSQGGRLFLPSKIMQSVRAIFLHELFWEFVQKAVYRGRTIIENIISIIQHVYPRQNAFFMFYLKKKLKIHKNSITSLHEKINGPPPNPHK